MMTVKKHNPISVGLWIFIAILFIITRIHAAEPPPEPAPFNSPEQAVENLIKAVKDADKHRILEILGNTEASQDIISSGDDVQDKNAHNAFLEAYNKKHNIQTKDDVATLVIGAEDWPFPIPIMSTVKGWVFDSASGQKTILYRRIGRNELDAIQVCLAYVDAQNDYANIMRKEEGKAFYARKFLSHPGDKDGLYWETKEGETPSPMGSLAADATEEGYKNPNRERKPYHGYYYKILTRQGPSAPGGAVDYLALNKMIGGFALVAWPADYGNSGIMTFIVNYNGIVYQKDLGTDTDELAQKIESYNPDQTWERAGSSNKQAQL